jgi:hypothetical protein
METNGGRIQGRDKRECPYRVNGLLVRRANIRIFLTGATGVIGRSALWGRRQCTRNAVMGGQVSR